MIKQLGGIMSIKVNQQNFKEEIALSPVPVLIAFYTEWSEPSKAMSPIIEKIAKEVGATAKVCKIDIDECPKIASQYQVKSVPYFVSVCENRAVKSVIGASTYEKIKSLLDLKSSRV